MSGAAMDAANNIVVTTDGAELDGVAVTGAGPTIYYFDSQGSADAIFTGSPTPTQFASEAQLAGASASAGDLDADTAGNLYASIFNGTIQKIWKIPAAGFGSATDMVAVANSTNLDEIEVDAKNSRLILSYADTFAPPTVEDIVTIPLTASGATPTVLVPEATLQAVIATLPGYTDAVTDDVNIYDMTVQSDGDIIVSHGFTSSLAPNGSLLRVTETGTVSVFATSDSIKTAAIAQIAGLTPGAVNIGSVKVECMTGDRIFIHCEFTSADAQLPPFMGVLDANGGNLKVLATETQFSDDTDAGLAAFTGASPAVTGATYFNMDGKHGDMAANDDYYFYRQQSGSTTASGLGNAVLVLKNINAFLIAGVDNWSIY
ncbi:MAG: hypothetical protein ABI579_07090 [Candidatus Sumerlaeota bacterium]